MNPSEAKGITKVRGHTEANPDIKPNRRALGGLTKLNPSPKGRHLGGPSSGPPRSRPLSDLLGPRWFRLLVLVPLLGDLPQSARQAEGKRPCLLWDLEGPIGRNDLGGRTKGLKSCLFAEVAMANLHLHLLKKRAKSLWIC